mgnify:CR=1 FL=1
MDWFSLLVEDAPKYKRVDNFFKLNDTFTKLPENDFLEIFHVSFVQFLQ